MTKKIIALMFVLISSATFADSKTECELTGNLITNSRKFARLAQSNVSDYFAKKYAIDYGNEIEDYATCMWYACSALCDGQEDKRPKLCSDPFTYSYRLFRDQVQVHDMHYFGDVKEAYYKTKSRLEELYWLK